MTIGKKFCPQCGSEDVMMVAGGITGGWMCKNCSYTGQFPEKAIVGATSQDKKVIEDIKDVIKQTKIKGRKK